MKQIHILMTFSRHDLWEKILDHYRPMNVILHPLVFADEHLPVTTEGWVEGFTAPIKKDASIVALINAFIEAAPLHGDDYYVLAADDDGYEPGVFEAIRQMNDPVIFISMKRGYRTPPDLDPLKQYPHNTLYATPGNVKIGSVGGEQIIMKGSVLKSIRYETGEREAISDGLVAIELKEKYPIRYEPALFALFNLFQPGRWEKIAGGMAFGVMVNDPLRLDMCLKQSTIDPSIPCHVLNNPESATKGLNKLLDLIEAEGTEIAVLVHQDMYFRKGWTEKVKTQLAKLPDSWMVAGIIGKDYQGRVCGVFRDMRIPLVFNTSDLHAFPHAACCFDEAVIIVNLKSGFRFDETMDGFDLYGTLCVLQTWERGGTAWVINAPAEHYCLRPFTWHPDEDFVRNYKWLYDRFSGRWRVDSTALGMSPDPQERERQQQAFIDGKAFFTSAA